jgi:hypothetical protein
MSSSIQTKIRVRNYVKSGKKLFPEETQNTNSTEQQKQGTFENSGIYNDSPNDIWLIHNIANHVRSLGGSAEIIVQFKKDEKGKVVTADPGNVKAACDLIIKFKNKTACVSVNKPTNVANQQKDVINKANKGAIYFNATSAQAFRNWFTENFK